jgi:hypothetical protein
MVSAMISPEKSHWAEGTAPGSLALKSVHCEDSAGWTLEQVLVTLQQRADPLRDLQQIERLFTGS